MPDLPTFSDATDALEGAVDSVQNHGRTLIPWLPDPLTCECGSQMYATVTFDPNMVEYVNAWECRADGCDAPDRYRDDPDVPDPDPPRPGAATLKEVLQH